MDEDLDEKLRAVEGDRPSPEFVARLRRRVLAEATTPPPAADAGPIAEFDIAARPPHETEASATTPRATFTMAVAALVIVVLAFSGIRWLATFDRDGETNVVTTTIDRQDPQPDDTAFAPNATRLSEDFAFVEEGTYRIDTLGTPFSFRTEQPLFVQPSSDGAVVFTHPSSSGPDDRNLALMRLSALSDPAMVNEPFDELDDGWAPDHIDGWLEALPDGVVVSGRADTTLGGLDATRVDLAPGETSCEPKSDWCVGFGTNRLTYSRSLQAGAIYRIWVVEQGDEEPLAVIAGIEGPADSGWFDTAEDIVSSLGFGDISPNPITSAPAGPAALPLLGGIRIELTEETVVSQVLEGFGRIPLGTQPADTKFVTNPRRLDGEILGTADELVALLRDRGAPVTELGTATVGGIDARVFRVTGDGVYLPAILRTQDDLGGWFPPPRGRLWLIDHPDRGLLMIEAQAFDDNEATFIAVLTATLQMLDSLAFVDLG